MFYVGYVKGNVRRLHYYGSDGRVAEQLYNGLKSGGAKSGLDITNLVIGHTNDLVENPTDDNLIKWVDEGKWIIK
jgi:hypothetical protein